MVSRVKTWIQEILTHTDLNAEFDNLITYLNAGQLAFPATQNASADVNTLDDYEEGTFTPTLGDGTNNYTLSSALGFYTKIGNTVTFQATVVWSSIGSAGAGQLRMGALPFTANASSGYKAAVTVGYFDDLDTTATLNQILAQINEGTTVVLIYRANDNAAATALAANSSGATGELILGGTYRL